MIDSGKSEVGRRTFQSVLTHIRLQSPWLWCEPT